ncbi:MAG: GNAT family N-acetyltransferase [Fimbriimonadaceae bacterium]|nr:MAG: GNAT family N-acetyltransferase [Fimbriimonadaceae bacterium]
MSGVVVEQFKGDLRDLMPLFQLSTGCDKPAIEKLIRIEETKGTEYGVIRLGGQAVGFIGIYIDENLGVRELEQCQVIDLAVLPEFQGKGFSRLLMDWAVNKVKAAGERIIWLYTGAASERNVAVYTKLGFELKAVMPDFWGEGEGKAWFRLEIGAPQPDNGIENS